MRFFIRLLVLLLITQAGYAQRPADGFIVTAREDGWGILLNVREGESTSSLSKEFHVPMSIVAEANMLSYNDSLKPGTHLYLPIGNYNRKSVLSPRGKSVRRIYYRVRSTDNLITLAKEARVPLATLKAWNRLTQTTVSAGTLLRVGWILYTPPSDKQGEVSTNDERPKYVLDTDTPTIHTDLHTDDPLNRDSTGGIVPPLEVLWNEQTQNGTNVISEKGSAGFFSLTRKATGAATYAFHNTAARGTIIRVRNIANGKVVFVKVLGTVPTTQQYYGCIIGLSGAQKLALGVHESKAFVELSYVSY